MVGRLEGKEASIHADDKSARKERKGQNGTERKGKDRKRTEKERK